MERSAGESPTANGQLEGERGSGDSPAPPLLLPIRPFPPSSVPVHILDERGTVFPAKERDEAEDFKMAVYRMIQMGGDEALAGAGADPDVGGAGAMEVDHAGENEKQKVQEEDDVGTHESAPQPYLTNLQQAQHELYQLMCLVDLIRGGEYMALERVSKMEPPEDSLLPLDRIVHEKMEKLRSASQMLRQRADRVRQVSAEQRAYLKGLRVLRQSWRIVAPQRGKSLAPLRPGEALAVDVSPTGVRAHRLVGLGRTSAGYPRPIGERKSGDLFTLEAIVWQRDSGCNRQQQPEEAPPLEGRWEIPWPISPHDTGSSTEAELATLQLRLRQEQHSAECEEIFARLRREAMSMRSDLTWGEQVDPHGVSVVHVLGNEISLGLNIKHGLSIHIRPIEVVEGKGEQQPPQTEHSFLTSVAQLALLSLQRFELVEVDTEAQKLSVTRELSRCLRHHILVKEVSDSLALIAEEVKSVMGSPLECHWTQVDAQTASSRIVVSFGAGFHFVLQVKERLVQVVSLPGFPTPAATRALYLSSVGDVLVFLRAEFARQVIVGVHRGLCELPLICECERQRGRLQATTLSREHIYFELVQPSQLRSLSGIQCRVKGVSFLGALVEKGICVPDPAGPAGLSSPIQWDLTPGDGIFAKLSTLLKLLEPHVKRRTAGGVS